MRCLTFKRKVLQFIKTGWIIFYDTPNMNSNPLHKHASESEGVNAINIGFVFMALTMVICTYITTIIRMTLIIARDFIIR